MASHFRFSDKFWTEQEQRLWGEAQKRHGGKIQIKAKDESWTWFWRFGSWLMGFIVRMLSGFKKPAPDYFNRYYVVVGRTIWVPSHKVHDNKSPASRFSILSHEIDHIDYTYFGDPDLQDEPPSPQHADLAERSIFARWGHQIMYLLSKRHRARVEEHGYRRTVQAGVLSRMTPSVTIRQAVSLYADAHRDFFKDIFTGNPYGYMHAEDLFELWWAGALRECVLMWEGHLSRNTALFDATLGLRTRDELPQ